MAAVSEAETEGAAEIEEATPIAPTTETTGAILGVDIGLVSPIVKGDMYDSASLSIIWLRTMMGFEGMFADWK